MKQRPDSVESVGDGIVGADLIAGTHAALSEGEQRFELIRRTVGLFLGPLALVLILLLPMPGLSVQAHRLAGIVILVVVWWITEPIPIPITALIGTALTVIFGIATAADAFAPFASPTIFLFIGSFIIGRAVEEHALDRRLATTLLSVPAIGSSLSRTRVGVGVLVIAISAWMSNTATTAMMMPIALGILNARTASAVRQTRGLAPGLLLVVAYAASIGGMITPVGSPPNLITIGLLERTVGIRLNFLTWIAVAAPIALVMGGLLFVAARWKFPVPELPARRDELGGAPRGGLTPGQRNCAVAFFTAVVLWITPGVLTLTMPDSPSVKLLVPRLDEAVVAVVAAALLFVLPTDWSKRKFTLGWSQAAQIDWGTILLFGGGLSLGRLMFVTGLAERVGTTIVGISGAESLWGITAMAILLGILLTELTSNTAATNMLVPVVISISQAAGLSPVAPAIGACLGASLAFMLPISTPPNAIVYGTGLVPIRTMISFGVMMDVVGFFVILTGLRMLCPLLGLA